MSYGLVHGSFWTDDLGRKWKVPVPGRLKFKYAGHAALRRFIFRRDQFTCVSCGWHPEKITIPYDGKLTPLGDIHEGDRWWYRGREFCWSALEIDHIHPRSQGGTNHPDNLQTLCSGCNCSKCDRLAA